LTLAHAPAQEISERDNGLSLNSFFCPRAQSLWEFDDLYKLSGSPSGEPAVLEPLFIERIRASFSMIRAQLATRPLNFMMSYWDKVSERDNGFVLSPTGIERPRDEDVNAVYRADFQVADQIISASIEPMGVGAEGAGRGLLLPMFSYPKILNGLPSYFNYRMALGEQLIGYSVRVPISDAGLAIQLIEDFHQVADSYTPPSGSP